MSVLRIPFASGSSVPFFRLAAHRMIFERHLSKVRPVPGPRLAPRLSLSTTMPLVDPVSSIITTLRNEKIIPEVIPEPGFTPSILLTVSYPSGQQVTPGKELARADTLDEPDIEFMPMAVPEQAFEQAEELSYTLVMTDPDAPSRAEPKYRQFRHWVVPGVKAPATSASETDNLNALKTKAALTPYRAPGPPPGSGLHRYVFLLFQEPVNFSVPRGEPEYGSALEERRSWDAIKFAEKYGLKLVGATYFLVRSEPKKTEENA